MSLWRNHYTSGFLNIGWGLLLYYLQSQYQNRSITWRKQKAYQGPPPPVSPLLSATEDRIQMHTHGQIHIQGFPHEPILSDIIELKASIIELNFNRLIIVSAPFVRGSQFNTLYQRIEVLTGHDSFWLRLWNLTSMASIAGTWNPTVGFKKCGML